jgi:hypothetical protein
MKTNWCPSINELKTLGGFQFRNEEFFARSKRPGIRYEVVGLSAILLPKKKGYFWMETN